MITLKNRIYISTFINQITQVINLIAYAMVGTLLNLWGFPVFGSLMVLSILVMLLTPRIMRISASL